MVLWTITLLWSLERTEITLSHGSLAIYYSIDKGWKEKGFERTEITLSHGSLATYYSIVVHCPLASDYTYVNNCGHGRNHPILCNNRSIDQKLINKLSILSFVVSSSWKLKTEVFDDVDYESSIIGGTKSPCGFLYSLATTGPIWIKSGFLLFLLSHTHYV